MYILLKRLLFLKEDFLMSEVQTVADYFGCNVFSDKVMRDRLPKNIYKSVMNTKKFGIALDDDVANVVANAMKDWAIEKGATHYTHWVSAYDRHYC